VNALYRPTTATGDLVETGLASSVAQLVGVGKNSSVVELLKVGERYLGVLVNGEQSLTVAPHYPCPACGGDDGNDAAEAACRPLD
jgi:hypothetical protein